jgi:hypothetical protein
MVNVAVANAGIEYIWGLNVTYVSTTQITISAGAARESGNVNDIILTAPLSVYTNIQGAGGIDQGAVVASTLYNLYLVGDSFKNNATTAVLSANGTAPTATPGGYDMYRLIARGIRVDGSSHILPFVRTGSGVTRIHKYNTPIAVLSGGTSATFADVNAAAYVPGNATIHLLGALTPNAAADKVMLRVNGSSATAGNSSFSGSVASVVQTMPIDVETDASGIFEYALTSASDAVTLSVVGFQDAL